MHQLSQVNHGYITGKSRVVENPGFVQKMPQTRVLGANHGYVTGKSWVWGWKQSPPEIYLQKIEQKYAVSRLNAIISCGVYKKNHEKRLL